MDNSKTVIISLGGSIVVPDEIDIGFVRSFRELIEAYVLQGYVFYIIVGGGKIARKYNNAANAIIKMESDELDWLGIYATRLNADFIRLIFKDIAYESIFTDPTEKIVTDKKVIIGGGWKPGWSTDYVSVELARTVGASKIANLSNIDYAYDSDPKTNPDAQKIHQTSWADYRRLIPDGWDPGLSTPFDPVASKLAEQYGIEVAIMNGKKLDNFKAYLEGAGFEGTVIK